MIHYRQLEIRDTRLCPRCGAVAGRCDHMPAENYILEVSEKVAQREIVLAWSPHELEKLEIYWRDGVTPTNIAELLNRSISAVKAQASRMRLQRKVAA